jgi:hypothetical protein
VPVVSELFGEVLNREVIPMEKTSLYKQDNLGLKSLDEKNKLVQVHVDDLHIRYTEEDLQNIIIPFLRL